MKFIKSIAHTLKQLKNLHKFSCDVIHGSLQFTVVLYMFAGVIYFIAPYTGDYMLSVSYYRGALEIAPVVLAGGVVSSLIIDLILRKTKPEQRPSDKDKKD